MITVLSWKLIVSLVFLTFLVWFLPKKLERLGSIVCCIMFLVFSSPISLCVLSISTIILYFTIGTNNHKTGKLIVNLTLLAGTLFVFKYITNATKIANVVSLGMSYYILREIHCLFESYKNQLPSKKFVDLVYYMFFLPTFLVGPINRYGQFIRDSRRKRWDSSLFSKGLERILFGYFKIVILSEYFIKNKLVMISHYENINKIITIYIDSIVYWIDLYLQFSGYSDIAIGFSALLGFTIIENFDFPFLAVNIIDFWKRWHISLTSWCRDYIYTPMLSFTRKPFVSICFAMIVLGLWHEISLRYIFWGVYHAAGIAVCHVFQKNKSKANIFNSKAAAVISKYSGWFITMNFVVLSYPITSYIQHRIDLYWKGF